MARNGMEAHCFCFVLWMTNKGKTGTDEGVNRMQGNVGSGWGGMGGLGEKLQGRLGLVEQCSIHNIYSCVTNRKHQQSHSHTYTRAKPTKCV